MAKRLWLRVGSGLIPIIAAGCGEAAALPGLAWRRSPHDGVPLPEASFIPSSSTSLSAQRVFRLEFEVIRIDIPHGGIRHSRKIWNHLKELTTQPQTVAQLARNGFRMGTGGHGAWPAIRAVLDSCEARVQTERLVAQSGLPVLVLVDRIDDSESIFSYGLDSGLSGKTHAAGEKIIAFDYLLRPDMGPTTELRISFEIRNDPGTMTWERGQGFIRQVPTVERHVFHEIDVSVSIAAAEFLVIGPSEKADVDHLVGARFLNRATAAESFETVFVVTPISSEAPSGKS